MIKLLAVDMDGTCLDRKSRITDGTIRTLRDAAAAGITVVPATGRSMACIPHRLAAGTIRKNIASYGKMSEDARNNQGLFRYVITSNGAQVTDIVEKRELFREMIPKEAALALLKQCRKIRLGVTSHMNNEYLLQGRILVLLGHLVYGRDAGAVRWVRDMSETVRTSGYEVEELQFYFMSPSARNEIRSVLAGFPELAAAYTRLYVEVFAAGASKGNALQALADHLGIRKEETACIGDGENDLSMFRAAGLKIAMGNAVPELKKAADIITGTNDRDGAAEAVRRYILCS